ncbi:hypothetical protein J0H58_12305 [bacterium]|nr:hypothetical protein [bacterium]
MDESPTDGFRHHPHWLLGVVAVVCAQAGLVLELFGPGHSFAALLDDRPVLSGRHPLHLYHGSLGAEAFRARGSTTVYDPNFQAGYPKTPVFDGGSRPAELVLALAGRGFSPAAYKVGLFACLLLVPLAFVLAARGAGLPAGAAVLAGAGGVVLSGSTQVHRLVEEGEIDFLMAGLGVIVFVCWLARYSKWFGIDSWLVMALVAAAGWYAHPVVWIGLVPVVIVFYVAVAPRKELAWHLGLLGIAAAGVAPNAWWLADWVRYWWLRVPATGEPLPVPTVEAVLGTPADYAALAGSVTWGWPVAVLSVAGLVLMAKAGHRGAAALVALTAGAAVALARVSAVWPQAPADAPDRLAPLAAGLLAVPAAFAVWAVKTRFRLAGPLTAVTVGGVLLLGWADGPTRPLAAVARVDGRPLLVGLGTEQQALVDAVTRHTTLEARVLWDDAAERRPGWNWTALLPVLTNRSYLGGLDPGSGVEHCTCGLRDGALNGRPLGDWTDADLDHFCRWYNVGWVVARSPAAADRWGRHPAATAVARLTEGGRPVVVFALDRPRSFVLSGSAVWEGAAPNRITLTNVVPDRDGYVTLSLHSVDGLRVYPTYILRSHGDDSEKDPAAVGADPVNHVRLRVPGPVPRVTLVWENP